MFPSIDLGTNIDIPETNYIFVDPDSGSLYDSDEIDIENIFDEEDFINFPVDIAPTESDTVRVEAENLDIDSGFTGLYLAHDDVTVLSLYNNSFDEFGNYTGVAEEGIASFTASDYGLSGVYDFTVSYYDQNESVGRLEVFVNDEQVGEIIFDEATSTDYPEEATRRQYTFEDLEIQNTDSISIRGFADHFADEDKLEWIAIDYFDFELDTSV